MKNSSNKRLKVELLKTLNDYLELVKHHLKKYEEIKALEVLEEIEKYYLDEAKDNYMFHLYCGIVLCDIDDKEHEEDIKSALKHFQKAYDLNKNDYKTCLKIAETLHENSQIECLQYYCHLTEMTLPNDVSKASVLMKYADRCKFYAMKPSPFIQRIEMLNEAETAYSEANELDKDQYNIDEQLKYITYNKNYICEFNIKSIIRKLERIKEPNAKYDLLDELYQTAELLPDNNQTKRNALKILYSVYPTDLDIFQKYVLILEKQDKTLSQSFYHENFSNNNPEIQEIAKNKLSEFFSEISSTIYSNNEIPSLKALSTISVLNNCSQEEFKKPFIEKLVNDSIIQMIQFSDKYNKSKENSVNQTITR